MKIGVEIEYWVVNDKGELISSKKLAEKVSFAEQEFVEPLIEIKTQPSKDAQQIKDEIEEKLIELTEEAENLGQNIVPLGTPLNSGEINQIQSKRGKLQRRIIGSDLEAAKRVAGTHIHFEQKNVKNQLNALIALDPALALTNSSPYYQGEKIAASSRNQVYRYKCYKQFPEHGQLWNYTDSQEEWEDRINKNFQKFTEKAENKGISKENIKENFTKYNALWTPVRLRKDFPTVEWRAPDTGKLEDTFRMIETITEIMQSPEKLEKPPKSKLNSLTKKSIQEGLENQKVKNYLKKLGFQTKKYNPITHEINQGENISRKKARKTRLKISRQLHSKIQ